MERIERDHPLYVLFHDLVQEAIVAESPARALEDVEDYVTRLLVHFMNTESVFAIRDACGRPLTSVYEMLAEADIRLNADSFEREREVHRHIGDYILFWSGVNPDFLRRLKLDDGRDLVCDYTQQGKQSYYVVSTFDYEPFGTIAPTFRRLSEGFEDFVSALRLVREQLPFRAA